MTSHKATAIEVAELDRSELMYHCKDSDKEKSSRVQI